MAGVRTPGSLTPLQEDFTSLKRGIGTIKTGGFPPFVVHVSRVPFEGGFITATGSRRVLVAPNGDARRGETTFAMTATEILGEERCPCLRRWEGPNLDRTLSGRVIVDESEPLREWQVFLWRPR